MTTYWELLRDPRWQRMRLEVMQRANFRCQDCGDDETTFNVHHTFYGKGRKPWEYEPEELRCLCEPCHERTTHVLESARRELGGLSSYNIAIVLGFVRGLAFRGGKDEQIELGPSANEIDGIAMAFECDDSDVVATIDPITGRVDGGKLLAISMRRRTERSVTIALEHFDKVNPPPETA